MTSPVAQFQKEKEENIQALGSDHALRETTARWMLEASRHKYSYHFTWLGRPVIQFPQDIVAIQELIWTVQPDLVIETGIAHGGSLILHASILEMLGGDRQVVGVDIDIRAHNRKAIEEHPLAKRITLIQGSSIDEDIVAQVAELAKGRKKVMVILDSNHTHAHVRRELDLYSPFVHAGSYLVVFDTIVEFMPDDFYPDRPWGRGDNPYTAVQDFLKSSDRFMVDKAIEDKLLITVAPSGYLKCVKG